VKLLDQQQHAYKLLLLVLAGSSHNHSTPPPFLLHADFQTTPQLYNLQILKIELSLFFLFFIIFEKKRNKKWLHLLHRHHSFKLMKPKP
jgi:hypothetical protein